MKMMELLKRLEKESQDEDPNLLEGDEDEDDDLEQRFGGIDLGELPCLPVLLALISVFRRLGVVRFAMVYAETR